MRQRGVGAVAACVLAASALAACSPEVEDDVPDDAAWRTSTAPVDTAGFVWAVGSTVHLGDGSTIDTGQPVGAFLLGGDGAFFVPAEADEDGNGRFAGADLYFAAPGVAAEDTGLDVDDEGVAVSPDGTHLAVLATDRDAGAAEMRLYDLAAGEAVTTDDGFDTDPTDPVHDLNESEVAILGISDDEVFARTTDGDWAYDLDSGEAREVGDDETIPGRGADPLAGPDGAARIERRDDLRDVVLTASGAEVVPQTGTPRWTLTRWLDEDTVLGAAIDGPGTGADVGPDDTLVLMTCEVPSGSCEPVPGTEGARVVLPTAPGQGGIIDLRPREAS